MLVLGSSSISDNFFYLHQHTQFKERGLTILLSINISMRMPLPSTLTSKDSRKSSTSPRISSALAVFERNIQSSKQHSNRSIPSMFDFGMESSPSAPRRSVGQPAVNRSPRGGENLGMKNRHNTMEKGPQVSSELKNLFVRLSMMEDDDTVEEIIDDHLDEEIIEYYEEVIEESEGALSELTESDKFCLELWG
jgi:hypothetical protein